MFNQLRYADSPPHQELGLGALWNLMFSHSGNQARVASLGGIEIALVALHSASDAMHNGGHYRSSGSSDSSGGSGSTAAATATAADATEQAGQYSAANNSNSGDSDSGDSGDVVYTEEALLNVALQALGLLRNVAALAANRQRIRQVGGLSFVE
jgi:hypothetical protein